MVKKGLVIGIVLAAGAGAVIYGLAVQREEPVTSSTIFSIIGATAGLLAITTALTRDQTPGETTGSVASGLSSVASAFR